ncbi:MAG: formate dehydrogenase accessory sulfurtransferase FdhD [Ruminococcus sp.]|jgi:FdhD protein
MTDHYMEETAAVRITSGVREKVWQPLLKEERISLYINGKDEGLFSCTPELVREMILGHLYSEGKIDDAEDVSFFRQQGNIVQVSCEKSGRKKERNEAADHFSGEMIQRWIEIFFQRSHRHQKTHASHKAMFFTKEESYLEADDVSRRAAIEKVIGLGLIRKVNFGNGALMFSGRVPEDVVEKIITSGIPLLIGRSYPTCEAVEKARKSGLILCGNAREDSFVLYAGKV